MNDLPQPDLRKATRFYHLILYSTIGLTAIIALLHYLSGAILIFSPEMDYYWLTSCVLVSIGLIPSAFYFYSRKAQQAKSEVEIQKKIALFQQALRVKFSLFAIAALVNLLYFALSANQQGLLFILMVLIVLLISKPTQTQFENEFFQQLPD